MQGGAFSTYAPAVAPLLLAPPLETTFPRPQWPAASFCAGLPYSQHPTIFPFPRPLLLLALFIPPREAKHIDSIEEEKKVNTQSR